MSQKRLLIIGAVLIATGIGTPVVAILAGGSDSAAPRPSAESAAPDEWLDPSAEPELFTAGDVPAVDKTTAPVQVEAGGRVPPGSGSRRLPTTKPPATSASATPDSTGTSSPTATSTATAATPPPADAEPPILLPLPLPLPEPEETAPPVGVPPPPLPED